MHAIPLHRPLAPVGVDGLGKVGADQFGAGFAPIVRFTANHHTFQCPLAVAAVGRGNKLVRVALECLHGLANGDEEFLRPKQTDVMQFGQLLAQGAGAIGKNDANAAFFQFVL